MTMLGQDIEARHTTKVTVDHKVVFWIDGQKYGFRCNEEFLNRLKTEDGAVIPEITYEWSTESLDFG